MRFLAFLSRETLIWKSCNTNKLSLPTQKHKRNNKDVLIEGARYYTILIEGIYNIPEGVLIERVVL